MIRNLAAGVDAFTSNVFLVDGERTVLVDPGANFDVVSALREVDGALDAVVVTHTHPDHVENARAVTEAFDVETWGFDVDHPAIDNELADGQTVDIGDHEYVALHTPGHKNDHLCLYAPEASTLFAGDLVFAGGGFGRTDLEEGNRSTLIESIEYVIETVDSLDTVYSGHGPEIDGDAVDDIELALRMARTR